MAEKLELTQSENKSVSISVRLPSAMYDRLERIAEKEGIAISSVIRQFVSYGFKKVKRKKR